MSSDAVAVDHKIMSKEIYDFLENLRDSIEVPIEISAEFNHIVICGMGASSIGGDIVRDCVIGSVKYPITVQRFPELPKWMGKETLAIISSYSGNTNETLAMYRQAVEKGCQIVIITAGGQMEELGKKNGDYIVKMPLGIQPRSALGLNLGYLINIIDRLCGTRYGAEIKKRLPALYKFRDKLCDEKGEAWKIAKGIDGRIPIVYATAGIYATAIRWMTQISENSKRMAFAGSVPEFNHNEIFGWSEGELRDKCVPVFLYEVAAPRAIREMADASIAALKKYGQDVMVIRIKGKTPLERTLRAVMIGDHVSLYLAYFMGVDPMDVKSINEFKSRLSKTMTSGRSKKQKKTK
jgi:glucose/mannose-6-phosphate isomerase